MKKLFMALSLVLSSTGAMAIPAQKGLWKTLTLSDGTQVNAQLMGDEHMHYWQTEDGRQLSETSFGYYADADMQQLNAMAQARRQTLKYNRRNNGRLNAIGDFMDYKGQKKGLIILVEFQNMKFQESNDQARYDRICNEPGYSEGSFKGSVYDYFYDQSYGQFELNFDVVGPVEMPKNYSYYGQDQGGSGDDAHPGEMVAAACEAVVDEVNFADYDWDGDGRVDQVMCIYAGQGQADGGASNTIWPHEWELSSSDYGQELVLDGVTIDTYAVANERSGNSIEGIGTICHEFSHCLGLPDMYDINYGGNFGMGEWSLMDQGSYGGNGFCPSGYSSFDRLTCGWVKPVELTRSQQIDNLRPLSDKGDVYIIRNAGFEDEYYLIENRQQKGWDKYVPDAGMLILHVDFDREIWQWNLVNTNMSGNNPNGYPANDHQRCTPFRPGGSGYYSHDTYPYNNLDSLTNFSSPAAKVYNPNSDGSMLMNKGIMNIKQKSSGNVSFYYRNRPTERVLPEGTLFYESFDDCIGSGGNDGAWGTTIASSTLFTDNVGWTTVKPYGGYRCARFGNGAEAGRATTPVIELKGPSTLTFRAAGWGKDGTGLQLSVEGDATISPNMVQMVTGRWTDYTATIEGSGEVKITFLPDKRFLIDEILVIDQQTQGIDHITADPVTEHSATAGNGSAMNNSGIYTLSGQRVDRPTHGLYIVNGRKVLVK